MGTMRTDISDASYTSSENEQFTSLKKAHFWLCGFPYSSYRARRYCGNKLNFNQFLGITACIFVALLMIILIPVIYCIVIPNSIQARFDSMVQSGDGITITPMTNTTKDGNNMVVNLKFPPFLALPGGVTVIGPTYIYLANTSTFTYKSWGYLKFPTDLSFQANKNADLTFDALFNITDIPAVIASTVKAQSNATNNNGLVFIRTSWTIKLSGVTWYKNLQLHSQQKIKTTGNGMSAQLFKMGEQMVMSSIVSGLGIGPTPTSSSTSSSSSTATTSTTNASSITNTPAVQILNASTTSARAAKTTTSTFVH